MAPLAMEITMAEIRGRVRPASRIWPSRATMQEMKNMKAMFDNPLINAALSFIEPFPVGLIITLISAAILRKKPRSAEAAA